MYYNYGFGNYINSKLKVNVSMLILKSKREAITLNQRGVRHQESSFAFFKKFLPPFYS